MTPTDQAKQDEDANLRKIVAQLHVNLGHPSKDAVARAIRLSGGSDDAIQAALKVRCTVFERLSEPSSVPASSLRRWTEFGQCVALDLFVFADTTLNMLDMAIHNQAGLVFPNVSGSTWEVSWNHPSVKWQSKLDVGCCQRPLCRRLRMPHVSEREERGNIAHDVWWTNFRSNGTILRQNYGFVQF